MVTLRDEISRLKESEAPRCTYAPPPDAVEQRSVLREAAELLSESGTLSLELWEYLGDTVDTKVERHWFSRPDLYCLQTSHYKRFGTHIGWLVEVAPDPRLSPWANSFISSDGRWYQAGIGAREQDESDYHWDSNGTWQGSRDDFGSVMARWVFEYLPSSPPANFALLESASRCPVHETFHPIWAANAAELRERVAGHFRRF